MEGVSSQLFELRQRLMKDMQLPEWLQVTCPDCGCDCGISAIMDISVLLTPKFFGNVAVGVLCPRCDTLSEFHYREAAPDADLRRFLSLSSPLSAPVLRHVLEVEPGGVLERKLWSQF
jgi:hypothetical protein